MGEPVWPTNFVPMKVCMFLVACFAIGCRKRTVTRRGACVLVLGACRGLCARRVKPCAGCQAPQSSPIARGATLHPPPPLLHWTPPVQTPMSNEILDNWSLPEAPRHALTVPRLLASQAAAGRQIGLIIDLANHDCL